VAVLLLLLTGAELYACEILSPGNCESFGIPQDAGSHQADDSCICCCPHVIVVQPILLDTSAPCVTALAAVSPVPPTKHSFGIYHPPRV
jgi:hypothetical protein